MGIMLISLLTFMAATGLVMSLYYALTAESPAAQRLRRLLPEGATAPRVQVAKPRPGSRIFQRVLAGVGQYSVGGADDSSLTQSLSVAGIRTKSAAALFVGVRTLLSFGPALFILFNQITAGRTMLRSVGFALFAFAYGHILVNYWLKRRARRRVRQLQTDLPDSLDLMVVCLEAGLGLNATIARVGEERASMNDPLGREFATVSHELREGRSREEALRALGDRNGVEDLKSLAGLIIQSDRLGASMAKTLRAHADVLRTKRRQRAEEAARKLPIKILFPLALFVLPPLFVIATGPALLRIQEMVKVITHG